MDEKDSKFFLVAQSDYLQRCVLTVDHLIHHTHPGHHSVLVFAGDTAGKISVWDITDRLIEYVSEEAVVTTKGSSCSPSSVKEHENPNFSCITPVENCLGRPLHVFKAHQSGVNDISIYKGTFYSSMPGNGYFTPSLCHSSFKVVKWHIFSFCLIFKVVRVTFCVAAEMIVHCLWQNGLFVQQKVGHVV